MFENSQDFLNIVKGISVLGLSAVLIWSIYYFAQILRLVYKIVKQVQNSMDKVEEIFSILKKKIEHSTSYLFLISEGVKKLVDVMREKKEEKKDSKES